jgi:hypothetical protein
MTGTEEWASSDAALALPQQPRGRTKYHIELYADGEPTVKKSTAHFVRDGAVVATVVLDRIESWWAE